MKLAHVGEKGAPCLLDGRNAGHCGGGNAREAWTASD